MTDADMLIAAQNRLTELATRALQMHRTAGTRRYILRVHNRWNYELAVHERERRPLDPETEAAFRELQSATEVLVNERGMDPDTVLHWLDLYPSMVVNVYLQAKQPHTV